MRHYTSAWIDQHLLGVLPEGFSRSQILLVPGNHDVDRAAVKSAARALQAFLLQEKEQPRERIEDVLADSVERGVLLKRHAAFLRFVNNYGVPEQRPRVPWWSLRREIKGCRLHLAGLCSSWMSWSDDDRGNLLVARWQVNTLFNDAPDDTDFRIVLVHHPWDYLAEFDARETQELILRNADLVLRGHMHQQQSITRFDPDNSLLELEAGSVYDGSDYANAFQLVELLPTDRSVRVHYRIWHNGKWLPDRNAYTGTPAGIAEFSLVRHAAATARPTPATPPCDPSTYLKRLRDQSQYIDIRGLQVGSGRIHRFPINQLYISLTTAVAALERPDGVDPGDRSDELDAGRAEPVDLLESLTHRCLVVLGDPGAGKTTFLRRIAFELCGIQLGQSRGSARGGWEALV